MPVRKSALLAFAASALLAIPVVPPALAGDAVDEEVAAFKDYLASKPAADALKNKIAEFGTKKDPRIADALMPLLGSAKFDEEVKAQVCLAVGKQGAPKYVGTMVAIVDGKDADDKTPKLVAAAMEAIGDMAPAAKYDWLVKMGNKYLDKNGDISAAAWKGVGNSNTKQAVEDLIKAAVRCDASGGDKAVPATVRANRGTAKTTIMNCLQKITGQEIKDSSVWDKWWRDEGKTWKPTPAGQEKADINASETFKDSAYGFSIKKPNKVWMFRKGNGAYLRLEANEEGSPAAWIEVAIESIKGKSPNTTDGYADVDKGNHEPKFRNLKEQVWDKKCSYAGVKGTEAILFGQHKDYDAVYMHNVYLLKGDLMFRFYCVWKSGKAQSLKDDIDTVLKSGIKFED